MNECFREDIVFFPLDRTVSYQAVTKVEQQMRAAADVSMVPRKTVAEMLLPHVTG